MDLPFDISPLDPERVVKYEIEESPDITRLFLWYHDEGAPVPSDWNISFPVKVIEHFCPHCSHRLNSRNSRWYWCLKFPNEPVENKEQTVPYLELQYYPKDNAKDKLVSICGRPCLVLGTTEVAENTDFLLKNKKLYVLSFYFLYEATSAKYNILQFCLYETETGKLFETPELKKLNDLLWQETTLHNFRIAPEWSVSKIYEIFMSRSV